jgi:hypothetical protein
MPAAIIANANPPMALTKSRPVSGEAPLRWSAFRRCAPPAARKSIVM